MGFVENSMVDSKRSWCILSVVFFSLFGAGGLQMSFGTILGALVDEFGESTSKIGLCRAFFRPCLYGQRRTIPVNFGLNRDLLFSTQVTDDSTPVGVHTLSLACPV